MNTNNLHNDSNSVTKIAFVHTHYPAGGVEMVTSMLAEFLKYHHYKIFVFVVHLNQRLLTTQDKENIHFIPVKDNDLFDKNAKDNRLIQAINEQNIDIVIFPVNTNYIFSQVKQHTKAKIIFAHHNRPFYETEFTRRLSLQKADKYSALRKWYYLKYRLPKKLVKHHKILQNEFYAVHQMSDAFTVLCEPYQHTFENELNIHEDSKITVISNAIKPLNQQPNLNKKQQLLYMGRMVYADKRIDRLIDIWKNIYQKFPDWEFILVGDGEERENLEKQAKSYGLERIQFFDATNNPYEYYNNASILCLSSQFEGIPLVLLEAQQSGVIPITFNCAAGVENVLSPNWENGVLIEKFSMIDYEKALCQLMSDENLRQQMQQNVIKKAQEYDIEKIGGMWHELFTKLLKKN